MSVDVRGAASSAEAATAATPGATPGATLATAATPAVVAATATSTNVFSRALHELRNLIKTCESCTTTLSNALDAVALDVSNSVVNDGMDNADVLHPDECDVGRTACAACTSMQQTTNTCRATHKRATPVWSRGSRACLADALAAAASDPTARPSPLPDDALTLVQLAARYGARAALTLLLDRGAGDVNDVSPAPWSVSPLLLAAGQGHNDVALDLLARGACAHHRTPLGSVLHAAARACSIKLVDALLVCGADVGALNFIRGTPLHSCCVRTVEGALDVCRALLGAGAAIDARDAQGNTPIFFTMQTNNVELAELLMRCGADVNAVNEGGATPLVWAAWKRRTQLVCAYVKGGAHVDGPPPHPPTPPLLLAAVNGDTHTMRVLLDAGARVSIRDKNGFTPLTAAVWHGHAAAAQLLLTHVSVSHGMHARVEGACATGARSATASATRGGCDVMRQGGGMLEDEGGREEEGAGVDRVDVNEAHPKYGFPPLLFAVISNNIDMLRVLLTAGAPRVRLNVTHPVQGDTPLHVAASNAECTPILGVLVEHEGVNLDVTDDNGNTPLTKAAYTGNEAGVRLLLRHGANADGHGRRHGERDMPSGDAAHTPPHVTNTRATERNTKHLTPLAAAACGGFTSICQLLLEHGANVHATCMNDFSALRCGALRSDVVRLLLAHGARVEHTCPDGVTALHAAAQGGAVDSMEALCDAGADVNAETLLRGETPLMLATLRGHAAAVRSLLRRGARVDMLSKAGMSPLAHAVVNGHAQVVHELLLHDEATVEAFAAEQAAPITNDHEEEGQQQPQQVQQQQQQQHGDAVRGLLPVNDMLTVIPSTPYLRGLTNIRSSYASAALLTMVVTVLKNADVARVMLQHGANPNVRVLGIVPLLHIAIWQGDEDMVRVLATARGVDLNLSCARQSAGGRVVLARGEQGEEEEEEEGGGHRYALYAPRALSLLLRFSQGFETRGIEEDEVEGDAAGQHTPMHGEAQTEDAGRVMPHHFGGYDEARMEQVLTSLGAAVEAGGSDGIQGGGHEHMHADEGRGGRDGGGAPSNLLVAGMQHFLQLTLGGSSLITTPLLVAVTMKSVSMVETLLTAGADARTRVDASHASLLHYAVVYGNASIVDLLLLRHAVDVDTIDMWGETPLFLACTMGDAVSVRILLRHGANVNARTRSWDAPLHAAVKNGESGAPLVRLLREARANLDVRDSEGNTALQIARARGLSEIVSMLEN